MVEPHNQPGPSANTAVAALSDGERSKVRSLLLANSPESAGLAVSLLQTLEATPADRTAVYDHGMLSQLVQSWDPRIWEVVFPDLSSEQNKTFAAVALLRFVASQSRDSWGPLRESLLRVWEWANEWSWRPCGGLRQLFKAHHCGQYRAFHQVSPWVDLEFVDQIDDSIANEIVAFNGDVHLNNVTSITVKQARLLASHSGWLYANGIASLEDDVADELTKHPSHIFLEGLTTLSHVGLAEKLASKSHVYLDSLVKVTDSAAAALARSKNQIFAKQLTGRFVAPQAVEDLS